MHDVLEGVAVHEMAHLFHYCITEVKYLTLMEFNQALINFHYDYTETDKPAPITRCTYSTDSKLRLTASQSLLLVRILPLLIGDKFPENNENWQCFLLL